MPHFHTLLMGLTRSGLGNFGTMIMGDSLSGLSGLGYLCKFNKAASFALPPLLCGLGYVVSNIKCILFQDAGASIVAAVSVIQTGISVFGNGTNHINNVNMRNFYL